MGDFEYPAVSFETHPDQYIHWDLETEGAVATLTMHIKEDHPMWEGMYDLKLNSYDLAVDIELHDAVNRLRFEHPEVRCVVLTGAYDKIFCAGANIRFLGSAPHAFKVNFCKYTNETRVGLEDATKNSGQVYLAALNGTASGGGYELALACEEILLIDDGNAAVSLPEVPLLGVLPGTGGLTRLTDKRKIRRDLSDIFCTKAEGFRARDAKKYKFIDGSFPRSKWHAGVAARAQEIVAEQAKKFPLRHGEGVSLPALTRTETEDGWTYPSIEVSIKGRVASLVMRGPTDAPERSANTWSLRAFRELEDALLRLRINHLEVGLINIRTQGDPARVLEHEAFILDGSESDWYLMEVKHFQAQCLRRLDNMSKSVFSIIEPGHCFVGILFELTLSGDRSYMLLDDELENTVQLSTANAGAYPMASGLSRLACRFPGEPDAPEAALAHVGTIDAEVAEELGIVTAAPDDIDWEDEVRIAIEERISLSPDALTGMEQNLRFGGAENCETKIYGRLSAWQNWIFQRPDAVGPEGALKLYGSGTRPSYSKERV
jgi:benzoyl-CoA-dihydrodiol lyase